MFVVTTEIGASLSARSGSADRHTTDTVSRSHSTSPFRPSTATAAAAAAAAAVADDDDDDNAVMSSSITDVDPVSVQRALRSFSTQLLTAEKERVSNVQSFSALVHL